MSQGFQKYGVEMLRSIYKCSEVSTSSSEKRSLVVSRGVKRCLVVSRGIQQFRLGTSKYEVI